MAARDAVYLRKLGSMQGQQRWVKQKGSKQKGSMQGQEDVIQQQGAKVDRLSRTSAQILKENEQLLWELEEERSQRMSTWSDTQDMMRRRFNEVNEECENLRIKLAEEREENLILQSERDRLQQEKQHLLADGTDGHTGNGSDQDSQYYREEMERLRSELRQMQLRLKETQLNSESSELVLEGYRKEINALTVERQALENLVDMLRRERSNNEDGQGSGSGIDPRTHQQAIDELVALEKEVTESRRQHQAAQDEIRKMAVQMTREQGQQARQLEELQFELGESKAAYEALLGEYRTLEQAHHALQLQLEEAYRMQRNAQAQTIYATASAPTRQQQPLLQQAPPGPRSTTTLSSYRAFPQNTTGAGRSGGSEFSQSMHRIRVPSLENWGEDFHRMPTGGPKDAYYFPVSVQESRLSEEWNLLGPAWLRITPDSVALLGQMSWDILTECPLGCVRKYGKDEGVLSFELGRHSPTGQGVLYLATVHMEDIFDVLGRVTGSR